MQRYTPLVCNILFNVLFTALSIDKIGKMDENTSLTTAKKQDN